MYVICLTGLVACVSLYAAGQLDPKQSRGIASIPLSIPQMIGIGDQSPVESIKAEIKTQVSVECETTDQIQMDSKAEMVMFKFAGCKNLKGKKLGQFTLHNESNGYQGKIFKSGANSLVSDYIQLHPGQNIIRLQVRLNDGQIKEKLFKITQIAR